MPRLSDLLTSAAAVRNESAAEQNTALRVGNVLYFLTQYLQQYTSVADISMKVSAVGVTITAKSQTSDTTLFDKTIALPVASNEQAGILTAEAFSAFLSDISELQENLTALSNEKDVLADRIKVNSENIADLGLTLRGKSANSSAYNDPFISLGDSNNWSDLNDKLNALSDQKYMGRCRATVSGVTVEIYQFINNFVKKDYTQVVLGNVSASDNNEQIKFSPNTFNILHRQHKNNLWLPWQRIYNAELQGLSNSVRSLLQRLSQVQENIFAICDSEGNIALKYDDLGFDVSKISEHFSSLLKDSVNSLINELRYRIQGTSENSSAYTDPFIYLGDSTDWVEFSAQLDGLSEQKYMGRCRARVDGVTVEVYQFINSFSKEDYTQVVLGNVSASDNGQILFTPNNFNILHRQHKDGTWSAWKRINNVEKELEEYKIAIQGLSNSVNSLLQSLSQVQENMFALCDSDGNIAMKYDNSGFDVAKISEHFSSLLGDSVSSKNLLQVIEVDEPGLFYVDAELNVGEKRDKTGTHAINLVEYINQ